MTRIGIGYDIHRLAAGEQLVLGGVEIPGTRGTIGHSDADALIHATIDALLGAASEGDIGDHFPPSDPAYKDISSRILLRRTRELLEARGWAVGNIDSVIILQEPKLSKYKEAMRRHIAEDLGIPAERVGIKAKTKEGLDAAGGREAVEAHAVALLYKAGSDEPPAPEEDTVWV
jgi:2-C-methyl-D-erythritol 2,4-cyclodiphosphate synthase